MKQPKVSAGLEAFLSYLREMEERSRMAEAEKPFGALTKLTMGPSCSARHWS